MIQPTVSSMMAEARITWPTVRRMKFISRITVATILSEAIDKAVPRNSDVISRLLGSGSMASGSASPNATPHRNGTAMPVSEANSEARPLWRAIFKSVSMPVRSSSMRMPNCAIASIIAFCSLAAGNSACWKSGTRAPKHGGAEQKTCDQLAHHRRLLHAQHGFAEQPADQEQHRDLEDEQQFRRRVRRVSGKRGSAHQRQQKQSSRQSAA